MLKNNKQTSWVALLSRRWVQLVRVAIFGEWIRQLWTTRLNGSDDDVESDAQCDGDANDDDDDNWTIVSSSRQIILKSSWLVSTPTFPSSHDGVGYSLVIFKSSITVRAVMLLLETTKCFRLSKIIHFTFRQAMIQFSLVTVYHSSPLNGAELRLDSQWFVYDNFLFYFGACDGFSCPCAVVLLV